MSCLARTFHLLYRFESTLIPFSAFRPELDTHSIQTNRRVFQKVTTIRLLEFLHIFSRFLLFIVQESGLISTKVCRHVVVQDLTTYKWLSPLVLVA